MNELAKFLVSQYLSYVKGIDVEVLTPQGVIVVKPQDILSNKAFSDYSLKEKE